MIKITVCKNCNKEYTGFTVAGHAGFSESGSDIVCSAVSLLVINTINSIEKFAEDEFTVSSDQESGIIELDLSRSPSEKAVLLLDSMILGIESIISDENYKNYVDIIFEEV